MDGIGAVQWDEIRGGPMTGEIHEGEHPFVPPEDERDPVRRLRGRLAAPVTIITAGTGDDRAGLTVSSLMLAEGDPGSVHFLLGPTADVYDAMTDTDRLVVHVLGHEHRTLSEIFAGRRPNPGGPFAGVATTESAWGPVIDAIPDRAFCSGISAAEQGYSLLVSARIDEVVVADLTDPLLYFRGSYRNLA
jgi:3-hydroxy-9,10-secoandrosta-1,3,5(10)-triene-9,17-dione monooxygenase reductase component